MLSNIEYWEKVIKVAKVTSLSRVKRAMTIMGRSEDEAEVDSSKVFYPILQATDIFCMNVDLAYAGLDQRRAHMLAREAAEKLGWRKPIALHTPLLPGLAGGNRMDPAASKMSKSKPDSNITIHDTIVQYVNTGGETIVVTYPFSVFFNKGAYDLRDGRDRINLQEVANAAVKHGLKVNLRGTCDSATASAAFNKTLAEKRCNKVKDELVKMGVPAGNITIDAVGGVSELKPAEYDRRVMIQLSK